MSGEIVLKIKQYSPWLEEKINYFWQNQFSGSRAHKVLHAWFTAAAQRLDLTLLNTAFAVILPKAKLFNGVDRTSLIIFRTAFFIKFSTI